MTDARHLAVAAPRVPRARWSRPRGRRALALAILAVAIPLAAVAAPQPQPTTQVDSQPQGASAAQQDGARAEVPWSVGERLIYDVRFGKLRVGSGTMEVVGLDRVRGREAWHTQFRVRGGTFFYRVNDLFESWIDTRTLASLRFVKDQEEGSRDRETRYEIFPERRTYQEAGRAEQPSVEQPLDDGSFLYFVRTLPLKPGETHELTRYFKPDRNPVRIRVLRRERITVPAGTFDAVVVQPVIKTKGIFSEGGQAEVWLSDDDRRMVLQMKSQLKFGSLNLYLRSAKQGA